MGLAVGCTQAAPGHTPERRCTTPAAIRLDNVAKRYVLYDHPAARLKDLIWPRASARGREFWALREVSLTLERGQVLGIVGRNGAGKSTLLQLVCGTLQPTSGTVEVNGRVAALLELGAGFNPEFTGRENVFMNAAILGATQEEVADKFDSIVEFAGVRDFIDQPVKTYSSGMFVRLAFAVATAFEPDILVIDEALSVGDGAFARKSFERIMALKEKGATILFCSHSTYHVDALCERALWLEAGKVQMLDAAQRVTAAYNDFLAKIETAPTPSPPKPVAELMTSAAAGSARIVRVQAECEGVVGREVPVISRQSDLTLRVEFAADPALPCPSVALAITNEARLGITSAIGFAHQGQVRCDASGNGLAVICFPAIALLKGRYYVDVFLACERGLHVYDTALQCVQLDVTQSGVLQGCVALPHRWQPCS